MNRIAYYYQEFEQVVSTVDDIPALIRLHVDSFEQNGWEVVKVDERDARRHPLFAVFDDATSVFSKSRNSWEYTRGCYMRWLAYAESGLPFADFDVINYGFTPKDAKDILHDNNTGLPAIISQAGAVGLFGPDDYRRVIDTFIGFRNDPVIAGPLVDDINDMTIMRHLCIDWYNCIGYDDDRFVKDYTRPGWEEAKLVHYPYSVTELPRAGTICSRRPIPAGHGA